jgi:hypothetical protein
VARATQAITRAICVDHIESAGKQPLQKSGKYRVNKIDEEIPRESPVTTQGTKYGRRRAQKANGPRLARPACSQIRKA